MLRDHDHITSVHVVNAGFIIQRLEAAGQTLLALPHTGPTTRLVQSGLHWIRDAADAYGYQKAQIRPAPPSAADITSMDIALAWIPLIPLDRHVLRRIVGARCLVNPMTGRHVYSWRRLGLAVGADHKAVQRWHAQGIAIIVKCLERQPVGLLHPPGKAYQVAKGTIAAPTPRPAAGGPS